MQVNLLPSQANETFAKIVRSGIQNLNAAVQPIPEDNEKTRIALTLASVITEALQETPPEGVVVDFTRHQSHEFRAGSGSSKTSGAAVAQHPRAANAG